MALVVLLIAAVAGIGVWLVLRSDSIDPAAAPIGVVEDFPAGSVVEVVLDVRFFDPVGVEADTDEAKGGSRDEVRLWVVNPTDGGLVALYQRSPWLGCRVAYGTAGEVPETFLRDVPSFIRGFFDPCHGGLFALDGTHLAGPGTRGLDRFPVRYLPDGVVVVDLTDLRTST